jgi:hypothetical protein
MDQRSQCKTWNFDTITGKIGKNLEDIDMGDYFLNRTPIAQEIVARTDK